jgi:hypothetical protein
LFFSSMATSTESRPIARRRRDYSLVSVANPSSAPTITSSPRSRDITSHRQATSLASMMTAFSSHGFPLGVPFGCRAPIARVTGTRRGQTRGLIRCEGIARVHSGHMGNGLYRTLPPGTDGRPNAGQPHFHSSTLSPGTDAKCRTLFVTTVASSATACEAIIRSRLPIGLPARSSAARMRA